MRALAIAPSITLVPRGVYRADFLNEDGDPLWLAVDATGRRVLEVPVSGDVTEAVARLRCVRALTIYPVRHPRRAVHLTLVED